MNKLKNIIIVVLISCFSVNGFSQVTGHLKGTVIDQSTGDPLPFVTVHLKNTDPPIGVVTLMDGTYSLKEVPIGRYDIEFSFQGYDPYITKEVLINSGKQVILDASLTESVINLDEVVVRPKINKQEPVNNLAGINARMLSVEEANRYAGGFDDPARLASSFAGVSSGIQSNGIVVRGNNPQSLLWRMEGVEISNPNHFADQSVFGGGGLTALSSQMLANSDFLTGAFPSSYSNAISGVFDLSMRTGNNEERESTFQLGLVGIDASSEGPFKKGGKSTYLFNYRYSTMALLEPILPEEAEGTKYQDLSFKLKLPTKNAGLFSIWGIGLLDTSGQKVKDQEDWEFQNDRLKMDVDQYMGATGIKHTYFVGEESYLESDIAVTADGLDLFSTETNFDLETSPDERVKNENWNIILQSQLNSQLSAKHTNQTGFRTSFLNYNLLLQDFDNTDQITLVNDQGSSMLLSVYSQSQVFLSPDLILLGGLNYQYFDLNQQSLIEPRLSFQYKLKKDRSIGLAYGLHSRTEKLNYYLNRDINGAQPNRNLKLTRSHHLVGSYDMLLNENLRLKFEPYYQQLFDVPVRSGSSFSFINLTNDWFINDPLVNEGEGRNYGLDITLERFLNKGYYFLITSSFFKSEYKGGDGIWRSTSFDRNFVSNALFGKEWFVGNNKSNILGMNIRFGIQGGQPYIPIDQTASQTVMEAVEIDSQAYQSSFDPTMVAHFSASYRINKPKKSSVWTLSIINASMTEEFEEFAYNFQTGVVEEVKNALVIPNISYKVEF